MVMSNELIAIEFQTAIQDGTIEVPVEYRTQLSGIVRVIILTQDTRRSSKIMHRLLDNPIDDPEFTPLSRDEIYNT
jgi:hypothetical protein